MKKMMITLAAIMMAVSMNAKNENVAPFEGVKVNVPVRVRFVYGTDYSLDIQAADSLVASALRWTVKDGVLKISTIDANEDMSNVCITIMSPNEPNVSVGRNMEMHETARNTSDMTAMHRAAGIDEAPASLPESHL